MDCIRPSIAPFPASRRPVGRAQTPSAASPGAKKRRNMGKGDGSRKRNFSMRALARLHRAMRGAAATNALTGRRDRRAPDRPRGRCRGRRSWSNSATALLLMRLRSHSRPPANVVHGWRLPNWPSNCNKIGRSASATKHVARSSPRRLRSRHPPQVSSLPARGSGQARHTRAATVPRRIAPVPSGSGRQSVPSSAQPSDRFPASTSLGRRPRS